jgi:hypothetical protein
MSAVAPKWLSRLNTVGASQRLVLGVLADATDRRDHLLDASSMITRCLLSEVAGFLSFLQVIDHSELKHPPSVG